MLRPSFFVALLFLCNVSCAVSQKCFATKKELQTAVKGYAGGGLKKKAAQKKYGVSCCIACLFGLYLCSAPAPSTLYTSCSRKKSVTGVFAKSLIFPVSLPI
jgi:hypothetical protein